jgi:phospholipid N-methyltransferase
VGWENVNVFERAARSEGPAIVFARNFFKNPKMLGSVIPSSRFLVEQLLRDIDWDEALVIIEFGPGVGTISGEILKRMRDDATLVVFEINDEFVDVLSRRFDDPRLRIVHRSASEVSDVLREFGLPPADCVISGIPFSIMSEDDRLAVLRNTYAALRDGGSLLVYQFSTRVRSDLETIFGRVHQQFEPRNILPARVFHCVK